MTAMETWKRQSEGRQLKASDRFEDACLLARHLVQSGGVTYVEVNMEGWDIPGGPGYFGELQAQVETFDRGFSRLIRDLESEEMLETTLVVVTSDYDRRHFFRQGRRIIDPARSVALLCGGGVEGGQVLGETDKTGNRTLSGRIRARQFNSLIARALRIDPFVTEFTPNGRPVSIGDKREPAFTGVFSPTE